MAQATGLTAEKTLELFEEMRQLIYGLGGSGSPLGDKLSDLDAELEENRQLLEELNNIILPKLQEDLAKNDILLAQLNETDLVNLQSALDDNLAELTDLNTITLPNLQMDLDTSKAELDQFNTVTLPNLLDEVSGIQGLFPITETQISDGAITTPKMIANTINGDRILANTLLAEKIVAGSISTDRMTVNTISGDRITANTLNASKIVAGTISTGHMTSNTINGDRITAGTLNANKITANTLSGDQIIANTINGDRIIANTINGDRIIANTINGDRIVANSINADRIVANSFYGRTITGATIQTDSSGGRLVMGPGFGGSMYVYSEDGNYSGMLGSWVSDRVTLSGADGKVFMIGAGVASYPGNIQADRVYATDARSAGSGTVPNTYMSSLGELTKTDWTPGSSARHLKRDIRDADVLKLDKIRRLRSVWFRWINVPENEPDVEQLGYIADEVHALGLEEFVEYRLDEGGEAKIVGVQYQKLVIPLLSMILDLEDRLLKLES